MKNLLKSNFYTTALIQCLVIIFVSGIYSEEIQEDTQMSLRSKNKFQISVLPFKYQDIYYFNYNLFEKISFSLKVNDSSISRKNIFKTNSREPSEVIFNYPFSTFGYIETYDKSSRSITFSGKYFPSIRIPFFIGLSISKNHLKTDRTFYFDKNLSNSNPSSYMVIDNTEINTYKLGPTIGFHYLFQEYFFLGIESFYGKEIARRSQYYPKNIIFEKSQTTVLDYYTQKEYHLSKSQDRKDIILFSIYIGLSF